MDISEANEGTAHVQTNYELHNNHVPSNSNHVHDESQDDDIESLRSALLEACLENERLQSQLSTHHDELVRVCNERDTLRSEVDELESRLNDEVERLQAELSKQTEKTRRFWRLRCEQMLEYDESTQAKEIEIALLHAQLATARTVGNRRVDSAAYIETIQLEPINETSDTLTTRRLETSTAQFSQKGKSPPVDLFTGESDVLWEDWLPTLERTATWNNWTENEKLLQLAGHLKGKAAQEWALLSTAEKSTFTIATTALGSRLDRGGKALATQEFHHTVQQSVEAVLDFVLRLEQTFRRAYGRENMSAETRDTLLYGQLQEGLKYTLVKSSAVSGARNYTVPCCPK